MSGFAGPRLDEIPPVKSAPVTRRAVLAGAAFAASGLAACASPTDPVAEATYVPPKSCVTVPLPGTRPGQSLASWRRDTNYLKANGIRLVRAPLSPWFGASPSGRPGLDFATPLVKDTVAALDHVREIGLSVLLATPGHAGGPIAESGGRYASRAGEYVRAVADQLGGRIDAWQFLNEPDRGHFRTYGKVSVGPEYWGEVRGVLAAARKALKSRLPGVPLTTTLGGWPCNDAAEKGWRLALDQLSEQLDVVGLDCYCGSDAAAIAALPARLQRISQTYGHPIWVIETGFPAGHGPALDQQGPWGLSAIRAARRGGAAVVGWYELRDPNPPASETGFGLLDVSWQPKPGASSVLKELA